MDYPNGGGGRKLTYEERRKRARPFDYPGYVPPTYEEQRKKARPFDYPGYVPPPAWTPPQIWPPAGMWEDLPEDFYTGARAWWKDIDEWAAEQVLTGYPFAQSPYSGLPQWTPPVGYGGGGGGGGGAFAFPEPKFTLRDILENLQFPQQMQYPSYLRDLGRYIEDLLTQNPQFAIPVPEIEAGELLPAPEDLDTLDYMETAEAFASAWNDFLHLLTELPFFQQQEYLGLRYGPETGWWQSGQVPTLPHPEYL